MITEASDLCVGSLRTKFTLGSGLCTVRSPLRPRESQVAADAFGAQRVGEARHLAQDLTLGDHNEENGKQREAGEGADDVEGVFGRGVVASPGDGAGQSVGLGDVLAPAKEREAGPHCGHQPDGAACQPDVGFSPSHRTRPGFRVRS